MRPRTLTHLAGEREATAGQAEALVAGLPEERLLWVAEPRSRAGAVRATALRRQLGRSADAVVVDFHDGVDADALAAAHGFVRGGGALILRWSEVPPPSPRLQLEPWPPEAVGRRLERRVRAASEVPTTTAAHPLEGPESGSSEQAELVGRLVDHLSGPPTLVALTARRGRGKSTALALALATYLRDGSAPRITLTGPQPAAVAEITDRLPLAYTPPLDALNHPTDVLVVDEAAQLSVALLRRLVAAHPGAHVLLATTTGGYEGTGRGFVLRFLRSLADDPRPLARETLATPIRWGPDDPLEAWVDARLLLDLPPPPRPPARPPARAETLTPDRLADDEALLQQVVALLSHAHYRTTPSDLHRLLDSPNLEVQVIRRGDTVLGATLVAREGGLDATRCDDMLWGRVRIRGHALADTLVCHAAHPEAGSWPLVRSVRIATHPEARRQGLARQLVGHVHATHTPALFGTLFGATPGLLRFRRSLGYEVVRLGASRGSRTGEPSAVMVRPCTPGARALVDALRRQLARDLPLQLRMLHGDGELPLEPALIDALGRGLPPAPPWTEAEALQAVAPYLIGGRPFEAVASALAWLRRQRGPLGKNAAIQQLVDARLLHGRSWAGLARDLGYPSVREAMRTMRRGLREAIPVPGR